MSRKSSILITISWKNPFILTAQFFDFFACFLRHQIPKNELFMKKMQPLNTTLAWGIFRSSTYLYIVVLVLNSHEINVTWPPSMLNLFVVVSLPSQISWTSLKLRSTFLISNSYIIINNLTDKKRLLISNLQN